MDWKKLIVGIALITLCATAVQADLLGDIIGALTGEGTGETGEESGTVPDTGEAKVLPSKRIDQVSMIKDIDLTSMEVDKEMLSEVGAGIINPKESEAFNLGGQACKLIYEENAINTWVCAEKESDLDNAIKERLTQIAEVTKDRQARGIDTKMKTPIVVVEEGIGEVVVGGE